MIREVVVDTNVFVYVLVGVEDHAATAARVMERAPAIVVPDVIQAEIANALWQWVTHKGVALEHAVLCLDRARRLMTEVVPSHRLWYEALVLALEQAHAVYDTLFVALARQRGTFVVSFDRRMKAAFPEVVKTPAEFLALVDSA